MGDDLYKIPKRREPATLWIHPDGPVRGDLYVQETSDRGERPEEPLEVLNTEAPFLVVHATEADEMRFYGKRSIVRVHHARPDDQMGPSDLTVVGCELRLMDGSVVSGRIREFLRPEHQRLFDYLNQRGEAFLRLYVDDNEVCLVNKAYIVRATEIDAEREDRA